MSKAHGKKGGGAQGHELNIPADYIGVKLKGRSERFACFFVPKEFKSPFL